jgi:hypothetical protein
MQVGLEHSNHKWLAVGWPQRIQQQCQDSSHLAQACRAAFGDEMGGDQDRFARAIELLDMEVCIIVYTVQHYTTLYYTTPHCTTVYLLYNCPVYFRHESCVVVCSTRLVDAVLYAGLLLALVLLDRAWLAWALRVA